MALNENEDGEEKTAGRKEETDSSNNQKTSIKRKPGSRLYRVASTPDPSQSAVFEQKLLLSTTAAVFVAIILWTVSVSTNFWFHVLAPEGSPIYINRTDDFFVSSHSGIWTICKVIIKTASATGSFNKSCHNHRIFPSTEQIQTNPEVDRTILDYTRTEVAFTIISYFLMFMGLGFSVYAFRERRYTFKRLAGAVHFISAASILVVIEVVENSVKYEEKYLTDRHPKGAYWSYGYSFIVAWFTFVLNLICGTIFILCSRKKKGQGGDDEPNIIGRI